MPGHLTSFKVGGHFGAKGSSLNDRGAGRRLRRFNYASESIRSGTWSHHRHTESCKPNKTKQNGRSRRSYPEFDLLSPPYPRGFKVRFLQENFRMRAAQPQEARLNHLPRWYNPPPCRNDRIRLEIPRAQSSVRHAKMGMSVMPPVATVPPELSRQLHSNPNRYQNEGQTCA